MMSEVAVLETVCGSCKNAEPESSSHTSLESHLLWDPESHTATNKAKPDHQIVLLGADKVRHCLSQETGVDEEGGNARDGVMLNERERERKWFVSLGPLCFQSVFD